MADNIVAGLFGLTPEMYGEQQRTSALAEGIRLAQLDPAARGAAMTYAGARGLGTAIGGAFGVEDPALMRITQQSQLMQGLDLRDPKSLEAAAIEANRMGNTPLAFKLLELADNAKVRAQQEQVRVQQAEAQRQTQIAQRIAQTAYEPGTLERAQILDVQEREQMADQGTPMPENIPAVAPSFDVGRVAPMLMRTPEGLAQLEKLQKAQSSVEVASATQLASQLFNPDGTRNKAVESQLRQSLSGQKILKTVEPETKILKKGDRLATLNQVTGTYDVVTPTGVVPTPAGANPISAMLQSGSITPTVRAYAAELETQWPSLDADERRNELSKLATKNQTATKIAQKAAENKAGGNEKVQSSKVTPNGTTIIVMKDGTTRVVSATGENLTGQARADAIIASEEFGATTQGTRAQARVGGELTAKEVGKAFAEIGKIRKNIGNIDDAIKAIDDGANTGVIASKFPNITTASITLNNVRSQLGLDVIGSVTFGALSEGELNLALDTALPTTLRPQALRQYLTDKKAAQEKLIGYLTKQVSYLNKPGNNLSGWLEQVGKQGQSNLPASAADIPSGVIVKKR
jgi:hypothetical protein